MAIRFRKSIRIGPGVKLNLGKTGASVRLGGRGYGITASSTGRVTRSVCIPGAGVSHVSGSRISGPSARSQRPGPTEAVRTASLDRKSVEQMVPKPGIFASAVERSFREGVVAYCLGELEKAADAFQRASDKDTKNISDEFFLGIIASRLGRKHEAIDALEHVVSNPIELPDALMAKYLANIGLTLKVAIVPDVVVEMPSDSTAAALSLAELYQAMKRPHDAIDLLEGLGEAGLDEGMVALSLGELYSTERQFDEVLRVTDGLLNTDDVSLRALLFRADALAAQGLREGALDVLKETMKSRKRDLNLLTRARYQRGLIYEALGRQALARKDFETVYASDPDFLDVRSKLQPGPE